MHQRCTNQAHPQYKDYGMRGIWVDPRWNTFAAFLADMGERPPGLSLDRIDNNGPYSKENCRWATWSQQMNNRRVARRITWGGQTKSLSDWAKWLGVPKITVAKRVYDYNWPLDLAVSTPKMGKVNPFQGS
jgi:hypothetical protein